MAVEVPENRREMALSGNKQRNFSSILSKRNNFAQVLEAP
jgi:hypothetical protein